MDYTDRILKRARATWPNARLRTARKWYHCDWVGCGRMIQRGDGYIDPGDVNPERAGGFGGYRYCLTHFQGKDTAA